MKAIEKHITDAIGIIEKTFDCHICVHGNRGDMVSITYYHLNKVCTLLKKNSARQSLYCMEFDSVAQYTAVFALRDGTYKITEWRE